MKSNAKPETDDAGTNPILVAEEELIPSSGFLAAMMERVREKPQCLNQFPSRGCARCPESCWLSLFSAGADLKWFARA